MAKKTIRLTESELISVIKKVLKEEKTLLKESVYDNIKNIYDSCAKETRPATLKRPELEKIAADIFDAIDGVGTDRTKLKTAITNSQSMVNFCAVSKLYNTLYGEDLLEAIDGDINLDGEWRQYVYLPLYSIQQNQIEYDAAATTQTTQTTTQTTQQSGDKTIPTMACWKKEKQSSGPANEGMQIHPDGDYVFYYDGKGASYGFYVNVSPSNAFYYKNEEDRKVGKSTKKGKAYCEGDEITFVSWV